MWKSIATALCLCTLLASPAFAGIYYEAITNIEDNSGKKIDSQKVKSWVDGAKLKVLFDEGGNNPMTATGSYIVTTDGGKTLFLVNPKDKTYAQWDLDAMLQTAGAMLNSLKGVVSVEFSSPESQLLGKESGGTILGYPTTHYRYRTSFTMRTKILGMKQESTTETLQDVWTTTAITDPGMFVWLRKEPPRTGNEEMDKFIRQEANKIEGVMLKNVSVSTTRNQKGKESTSKSTSVVTVLREESVPGNTFDIPSDYQRTEMMPTAGMPQEQGSGKAGGEEEQESTGKKLRGMLDKLRKKDG